MNSTKDTFSWEYSFPIEESWNIENEFAKWQLPCLQLFTEQTMLLPPATSPKVLRDKFGNEHAHKLWIKYLKEMLFAFIYYAEDYKYLKYPKYDAVIERRISRGIHLFAKFFQHLCIDK